MSFHMILPFYIVYVNQFVVSAITSIKLLKAISYLTLLFSQSYLRIAVLHIGRSKWQNLILVCCISSCYCFCASFVLRWLSIFAQSSPQFIPSIANVPCA
jgi:hypothetical protein